MKETGVLENDIVVEDLADLAHECGFRDTTLIPVSPLAQTEIRAKDLGAFMRGKGFLHYWRKLCQALEGHSYVFLHKGGREPTTRAPRTLRAEFRIPRRHRRLRAKVGQSPIVRAVIENFGDTRWLSASDLDHGWTRLGAHLYRSGDPPELVDFDWFRAELPKDVGCREKVKMTIELPALERPGQYIVGFDLVVEGLIWFADRGSTVAEVTLQVDAE